MKGIATIIRSDGVIVDAEVISKIELDKLQEAVEGPIEVVPMFDLYKNEHCVAFCNEEGKLRELPLNDVATKLWWDQRHPHPIDDVLCGDVIIIRGDNELMEAL